jgi:hypothetical protein
MNKKILVPLGQYDRGEEMIPGAESHTQRRCPFDYDARGNRRLDCTPL